MSAETREPRLQHAAQARLAGPGDPAFRTVSGGIFAGRLLQLLCPSVVALVVGFPYTIYFIGWSPLNVTNIAWLQNGLDRTQAYLGWAFLRLDPVWHFPPTFTEWLGWPAGVSVAFTDSIPLVAVVARFLSPLLPEHFQYFGLWMLACFVLNAYFAFRLCSVFTGKFNLAAFFGGLLLVIAPSATFRILDHLALTSHFLVLLSLWLYFKPYPDDGWRRATLPQVGTVALAASIHPYLVVMTGIVSTAYFSRRVLERRCTWWAAAFSLIAVAGGAVACLVVFGYFVGGDVASYNSDLGYRYYSFNLLSPFNSLGFSRFVPPLPIATSGQDKVVNFLGLGILLLLVLNARSVLTSLPRLIRADLVAITLSSVVLTALAASTLITFGPYVLVDLQPPDGITQILAAFRVSDRLFWPVGYLIMVSAIYFTWRNFRPRYATAIVAVAVIVQFADEAPLRAAAWARFENRPPSPFKAEVWNGLGATAAKLLVAPPWQCGALQTPGGLRGFSYLGALAAAQGLKTNNVYQARPAPKAADLHCRAMLENILHGELEPDAAYVLSDGFALGLALAGTSSHNCEQVDGFNLCRPRRPNEPASTGWVGWLDLIPTVADSGELRIGDTNWHDIALVYGWSSREGSHVWNTGNSELVFRVTPLQQAGSPRVELTLSAMLDRGAQGWSISIDDGRFAVDGVAYSLAPFTVSVPLVANGEGIVRLWLSAKVPVSPQSQGINADSRRLGLNLLAVRLVR
jgi:hypothetical protein